MRIRLCWQSYPLLFPKIFPKKLALAWGVPAATGWALYSFGPPRGVLRLVVGPAGPDLTRAAA